MIDSVYGQQVTNAKMEMKSMVEKMGAMMSKAIEVDPHCMVG